MAATYPDIVLYCFDKYNVWIDYIASCSYIMPHLTNLKDKPTGKAGCWVELLEKRSGDHTTFHH